MLLPVSGLEELGVLLGAFLPEQQHRGLLHTQVLQAYAICSHSCATVGASGTNTQWHEGRRALARSLCEAAEYPMDEIEKLVDDWLGSSRG